MHGKVPPRPMTAVDLQAKRFQAVPESAAVARQFVEDVVRDTAVDAFDAALLTSELVSNAIVHAHTEFEVLVCFEPSGAVRVSVIDHAPELLLVANGSRANAGWGLKIIDAVASAWGFERRPASKLVWFLLPPANR